MPSRRTDRPARGTGRQALMRAAVEVVGTNGLENATLRRIADAAGLDNTLITHYFGSRDALLAETASWVFDQQLEIAEVSIDFALDPSARAALVDSVDADPVLQIFLYEMTLAARRQPDLYGGILTLYAKYVERMRASLRARDLPDDEPFARATFAIVDGLVLQQVTIASRDEVDQAFAAFGVALVDAREGLRAGVSDR